MKSPDRVDMGEDEKERELGDENEPDLSLKIGNVISKATEKAHEIDCLMNEALRLLGCEGEE